MLTFSLRGSLVRPHFKAVRISPAGFGRANTRQVSRRQQSSSASHPSSSSSSSSSSLPEPSHPPESASRAPAPTPPAPQITQRNVTAQAISETKIDPIPAPVANVVAPVPVWQRLGPLTRAGQAYGRAQRAHPWATQVASALLIYLCADFGAQRLDPGGIGTRDDDDAAGRRHDWARTARSLTIGGAVAIPSFVWFAFLSRSFNYSSKVLSIAVKVTVSQLVFAPLFSVYFFGSQALLSGDSPEEAWRRVCNTVPASYVNSCKLWPAVTAFSFAVVPFEWRSLFAGAVGVGWQTYLNYLNGRAERIEALRKQNEGGGGGDGEEERRAVSLEQKPSLMRVRDLPAAANQAVVLA